VMLALYDYPKTASHPAFTLSLKVNFAEGGGENQAFRFVGPEGVLTIGGGGVTLAKKPRAKDPGYSIDTYPEAMQKELVKAHRSKYPAQPELQPVTEETFSAPPGYYDGYDHFVNFFDSVRTRKASVEDAVFGFRAAAPALLTNDSYFEGRPIAWDPETMKRVSRADTGSRQ
jgi:hypothetical protein